nr:WbqC family protein [Flavobacteriales bacterium]
MVPVLPAFYFGSVEHYRLLARHPHVIIDTGEHYERQSYRTRTRIVGPNGVQDLTVPIARRSGEKMPMRDIRPSYAETWPQQQVHAIRSAYGNTPWFIHYIDALEGVILQRHERLIDLDLATMRLAMKWLGLTTEVEVREAYVEVASEEWRKGSEGATPHPPLPTPPPGLRPPTTLHP